jgi:hypothetical protein
VFRYHPIFPFSEPDQGFSYAWKIAMGSFHIVSVYICSDIDRFLRRRRKVSRLVVLTEFLMLNQGSHMVRIHISKGINVFLPCNSSIHHSAAIDLLDWLWAQGHSRLPHGRNNSCSPWSCWPDPYLVCEADRMLSQPSVRWDRCGKDPWQAIVRSHLLNAWVKRWQASNKINLMT